ncbi:MAG: hypothetical protein WC712_01125 [Candidatus Brocadiia bacterium]
MPCRRLFTIVLLAAAFCLTVSVPRADEPPADLLAKYMPANTIFYAQLADLGGTLARGRELAVYKFIEEGNLLQAAADALNEGMAGGGEPHIDFDKILTMIDEMRDPLSDAFTGRIELAIPMFRDEMPIVVVAFRAKDGRDESAKAALALFLKKFSEDIMAPGFFSLGSLEYKGLSLNSILDEDRQEDDCPWFFESNGFVYMSIGKEAICRIVDMLAQPPEKSLLDFAPFRKGYSATPFTDLFCYFSLGSTFQQFPDLRGGLADFLGEKIPSIENGTLLYGMSFKGLSVEDELLADLNGGTWPLPLDFLLSEAPCTGSSAALFPEDTAAFICQNMSIAKLFEAARGGPFINLSTDALKDKGFDAEADLLPLLGPEVGFGLIARGIIPTGAFAIEMRDPAKVTEWVRGLAAGLPDAFGEPSDYKGALLIPCLGTDIPEIFGAMAIAVKDKWLLFGPILTLKSMIGAKEGAGLTTNADYAATMPQMLKKQPQTALFVNLRVLACAYYDMLINQLARQGREAAQITMNLPTVERVQELAVPIAMCLKITSGDARLFATSPAVICGTFPLAALRAIPSTIRARKHAAEYAVIMAVRSFGSAAAAQLLDKAAYWENGATDFKPYFADNNPHPGYSLSYFSNDTNGNGIAEATEFVYIAVPVGAAIGRRVFYMDETGTFFEAYPRTVEQLKALQELKEADINWGDKTGSKIVIADLDFLRN